MAKSRRRSIYPILLIVLVNGLVFAGSVVPLAYYGFEQGPPVDINAAGFAGWLSLVLAVVGLAVLILGGVLLRAIPKIPALTLGVYPASVAALGLIGTQLGAGMTLDAVAAVDPSQSTRVLGLGLSGALNASLIAFYVAAALMVGSALTIALRHWPSRSSLSSGGKFGLIGGAFLLIAMIVGSLFWKPLGGLGILPWTTSFVGLVAIALAAHAIRNDPTDEANVQAAGELWVTMLLGLGGLVFVCTARHTSSLMEGLAAFEGTGMGRPDLSPAIQAWTHAEPALYASTLYAVPLVFAAISSMLSREALGSWGLRNAAVSILVVPIFFVAPSALAHVQTTWAAKQVAKTLVCSTNVLANPDLTIPTTSSPLSEDCPPSTLQLGRASILLDAEKVGDTGDLDSVDGCKKIASKIGVSSQVGWDVVADESLSYARMACLAQALADNLELKNRTELYRQIQSSRSSGREGILFNWVLKGTRAETSGARAPFDQLGAPTVRMPAFGPVSEGWDPNLVRIHLFEGGWVLQRAAGASKMRVEASPQEGIKKLEAALGTNYGALVVAISADRSVRMGDLLQYASLFPTPQLVLPEEPKPKVEQADAGAPDGAADTEAGSSEAGSSEAGSSEEAGRATDGG